MSIDTCRLIHFARWISAGGRGLNKGKFTLGKGSESHEEGMTAEQLACLMNHEQPREAGLEGLAGLLRVLLKHVGFIL